MNGHIKIIVNHDLFEPFHTKSKTGRERCALLIGKFRKEDDTFLVDDVLEVTNAHADPVNHYRITKGAAGKALLKGGYSDEDVIGSLHTHTRGGPDPSYEDCYYSPDGALGIVLHERTKTVTFYDRQGFINKEMWQ
jgi:proteasome lid subunit RPN8/RPN11